ncbi:MAG: HD domain-containing phosphohydrolase [Planctomycetota bacterium]|jgi:HD-GYP domain-containing protein (c-di-GMP phosphodiesterase class II)
MIETIHVLYDTERVKSVLEKVTNGWAEGVELIFVGEADELSPYFGQFNIILVHFKHYNPVDFSPRPDRHHSVILWENEVGETPTEFHYDTKVIEILRASLKDFKVEFAMRQARNMLFMQAENAKLQTRLAQSDKELKTLNRIGVALSAEKDTNTLLDTILSKSREITSADAGTLYLVETPEGKSDDTAISEKLLRFAWAQNDSLELDYSTFFMPITPRSMAGNVAINDETLNIPDVYELPGDVEYGFDKSIDEKTGYRTKSVLTIPINNHRDEVIGVLQLINKKRDFSIKLGTPQAVEREVLPFNQKSAALAGSLAGQAGVALENMRLYQDIRNLFEGFIRASVHAIEQRDPTTSGHSERVAELTVGLAEAVNSTNEGPYKDAYFTKEQIREIRYAGLLHDFGKIGVREDVLIKGKKLYPAEIEAIRARYQLLKKAIEAKYEHEKVKNLIEKTREETRVILKNMDGERDGKMDALQEFLDFIMKCNEPSVLEKGGFEKLHDIALKAFSDPELGTIPYLTEGEAKRLSIGKGTLSEEERKEIESHVTHTHNFLKRIPWTKELKLVPEIAYGHHEKLDGTGYPRGIPGKEILLAAKMMIIADIFDALTAADRPYKRAVPVEKALAILGYEVSDGHIDEDLLKLFTERKVYERVIEQ